MENRNLGRVCQKCGHVRQQYEGPPYADCPVCSTNYASFDAELLRARSIRNARASLNKPETSEASASKNSRWQSAWCTWKEARAKRKLAASQQLPPISGIEPKRNSTAKTLFYLLGVLLLIGLFSEKPTTPPQPPVSPKPSALVPKPQPSVVAQPTPAPPPEKKECDPTDLQCLGDRLSLLAVGPCSSAIEKLAKYQSTWTDAWYEPKFSHFRWASASKNQITLIGDKIKFQNGFGAWQFHIYECDVTKDGLVLAVRASPGRLQ